MGKIAAIIWKDARLRFSGPSELVFFILLPIVFTFLLAGGTPSGDEDNRLRMLVVDQAGTLISARLITELEHSSAVRPEMMSLEQAQGEFVRRRASVLLIIPAGLDVETIRDGTAEVELRQQPNDINAIVAARAVQTALRRVGSTVQAANVAVEEAGARQNFESDEARRAYFDQALELARTVQAEAPERVTAVRGATVDRIEYDPRANSSAGQLITWVFIPLFGISSLFAYERQQGTLRRILTTPTGKAAYLFGTIAGQVLIAVVQMTLLVLFGIFVMGLQWGRDPVALAVILVASALAGASIGTAMGTFIKTEGQASGLSIMLGMVMALLGGCWYPLELFPAAVQTAVKALPTTWAMQGMLDLVLRGGGLMDVLPEAGVLSGFAALFLTIGILRFRYE